MENKGLIGFLIAALLAAIGFLIYWFFFRKKSYVPETVPNASVPSVPAAPVAANPISNQDTTSTYPPGYFPISSNKEGLSGDALEVSNYTTILSTGFSDQPQEPMQNGNALSQRANNPGALFWDGSTNWQGMNKSLTKSGQIIYFDSVDYGVRAQLMTLKNYYKLHGITTLNGITTRYAPLGHGSNDPFAYARTLASFMGMEPNDNFNMDSNRPLLAAIGYYIHRVEAGYFWVSRSKYLEWSTKV